LERYRGSIAHRPLIPALSVVQIDALSSFADMNLGRPFNFSPYYSVRALHRRNRAGTGVRFFCTELVAAAYQRVHVAA